MGLGVGIFLAAVGAVLAFAVNKDVSGVNIHTIGWILLIVGIVQLAAGFMVFSGNPSGNMLGICVAAFALFIWFFFVFVAPIGALIALVINGLVIYGLSVGSNTEF